MPTINQARRYFLVSAGLLLSLTAMAKFVSATGNAPVLQHMDPILSIQFRNVFWIIGTVEMAVALACFLAGRQKYLAPLLVAWLATCFVLYRFGSLWVGYVKPCSCLGTLTDALHISDKVANTVLKLIIGYLLIGSYAILCWTWQQKQEPLANERPPVAGDSVQPQV